MVFMLHPRGPAPWKKARKNAPDSSFSRCSKASAAAPSTCPLTRVQAHRPLLGQQAHQREDEALLVVDDVLRERCVRGGGLGLARGRGEVVRSVLDANGAPGQP